MMKKLLALLLSMMMAVSLAVPAFAAETNEVRADGVPGFWTQDSSGLWIPAPIYKPGDAIPINAFLPEADNNFTIGIIGGADGPTSIITTPIPGLEGLGGIGWGELEGLVQQYEQRLIDSTKEALGGVAGQVGVMVNGVYVKFPDAAPEVKDGTTMVPVRALVDALGGQVSYQDGEDKTGFVSMPQVVCTANGVTVTFEANGANVEVERQSSYDSGETETDSVTMPVCTYQKDGCTYVPLRFLAGTLGYEVGWDSAFQTAILLDREALAAKFDEKFTIMNRVQANQSPALKDGESWSADVKGSVTVTAFDTLNGNKTYTADFTEKTLRNGEAVSGAYSLKLSGNAADLLIGQYEGQMDEEALERMGLLLDAVEDAEVIMTREGLMWVHSAALDELGGEKDIWCGMSMDEGEVQRTFAGADASTVGTALAAMMSTDSVMVSTDSVVDYSNTVSMRAQMMYELYGDDKFTTSGGVSTCTIGVDELMALYENMGLGYAVTDLEDVFKEYSIVIKVDSKGGVTVTGKIETAADIQAGMPGMKMTMDATQSGGKATVTMSAHIANLGEMELTLTTTQKAVAGKPMTEPPAGANIVDAPELLNGYGE